MSCEVIDLVSILPWDEETIYESVKKTGRCIVTHEAPLTNGFGAELAAAIQVTFFLKQTNQYSVSNLVLPVFKSTKKIGEKSLMELLSNHTHFRVTAS